MAGSIADSFPGFNFGFARGSLLACDDFAAESKGAFGPALLAGRSVVGGCENRPLLPIALGDVAVGALGVLGVLGPLPEIRDGLGLAWETAIESLDWVAMWV